MWVVAVRRWTSLRLGAERGKLMNELDSDPQPEELTDPAADEDLVAGFSAETSYSAAAQRPTAS